MGVAGLWSVLRPASETRSLINIAVKDGFETNPRGVRGYRIGIDASIWLFHMEYGREGENPHLRTLFFRCATLMSAPFLPLFVFDGPKRPDFKRGKRINTSQNVLIPSMKQIIEAFGFEHRTAPGEAEAELAYLNRIGVIDGILSDDVDNFLFGATTVIRNSSNLLSGNRANPALNSAGKYDKNHSRVYKMEDIMSHPDVGLTRGGLILIGLLSGGDYDQVGLQGCGIKTSVALTKCGFGDTLYKAATTLPCERLPAFLDNWRCELRHEIDTNSRGILGRRFPALAKSLTNAFPDIDVLLSYANPITSETMGKPCSPHEIRWNKEPDISKLAGICERFFEWGYREAIIKRFRTVIWHSAVLRILRRAVLNLDQSKRANGASSQRPPKTPSRSGRGNSEPSGTPSKMITQYFSTMGITSPQYSRPDENEDERLIVKIHSTRTHASTDGLLEYRLEIVPAQLVRLAEHGVQGMRPKPTQEWESEEEGDEEKDQASSNPKDRMRLWMPACMVKLVEPGLVEDFHTEVARKAAKKDGKGQGKGGKKKATHDDGGDVPVSPSKAKPIRPRAASARDLEDGDGTSAAPKGSSKTATTATGKSKGRSTAVAVLSSGEEESEGKLPSTSCLFPSARQETRVSLRATVSEPRASDVFSSAGGIDGLSPSPRRRVGVRDLTKNTAAPTGNSTGITSTPQPGVPVPKLIPSSAPTKSSFVSSLFNPKRPNATLSVTAATTPTTNSTTNTKCRTRPASFPVLAFFDNKDDDDDEDEMLDYNTLFTSLSWGRDLTANANTVATSNSTSASVPTSASTSSSTSASVSTSMPTSTSPSSPSKRGRSRKTNNLLLSDSSDSGGSDSALIRYRKFPRRSSPYSSPATPSSNSPRCGSPTPDGGLSRGSNGVIGIGVGVPVKAKAIGRSVSGSSGASRTTKTASISSSTHVQPPSKSKNATAFLQTIKKSVDLTTLPFYKTSSDLDEDDDELPARIFSTASGKKKKSSTTKTTKTMTATHEVKTASSSLTASKQIDFIDLT